MKCSKNLERAIVLGLMLSSIAVPAWAADIEFYGNVNGWGNTFGYEKNKIDINGININVSGSDKKDDTTAAIIFDDAKEHTITGNVYIVNTVDAPDGEDPTLNIANNDGLQVINGTKVNITGDDVYIASLGGSGYKNGLVRKKSTALSASTKNGNRITVSGDRVRIIGNIDFVSSDTSAKNNEIRVTFNSTDSYFYGDVNDTLKVFIFKYKQGTAYVTLNNGAEWIYDEIPEIENLELNGGIVALDDAYIQNKYENEVVKVYDEEGNVVDEVKLSDDRTANHKDVTIENLKGNGGIFKTDIDWLSNNGAKKATDNSDYIFIENSEVGSTQTLDFDASKANFDKMNIGDKLYFANVEDGNTAFTTTMGTNAVYSNASNIYNYQYGVGSETGSTGEDWYIGLTGKSAEGNANFEAAKGAMYAGYALGTELDTLNKRMGEARYLENDNGVWVRYRHSKTGWDDTYETNGDMFQLGFDNEVTEKDGKHYRGVAIDYTDADTNIIGISGEGEHERYAVSLYDTWLGEKGHYRDLVLRGGRINSDYDVSGAFSSGYEDIGGDYHQWFGSISAEWGRKNDMGTGWYFEPQVQAHLARVGGASYVSDSGVDVDQDGATSLSGRAGFRIGREYVKDNGKHDNFYIKADLLHEFAGDKSFSLTGNDGRYDKEYDGQETWCDVGIGADISLGKNSYFWADVERTFGADFDNTWQINGGFRWEF
ncbi:autotransporter outer membrane beta-barrel domain-containing protein [Phascolarctobacterium sp. ET69]|uniref:autotransporter outer membrane beta-barrel domain-containing protein n=1 Tax=Phascolarctobacterium sp. ET69 TaxID=2939420 RepID=UPI0020139B7F|nr:autotransporter outer membrane beta-barrel domain-containing protein [Phascolarctobacterium sp. ET69]MCL1606135.1 autotransporter outer membrane beta-barrel domain-containing protein [Phascolarctobacterium sp. ET69]